MEVSVIMSVYRTKEKYLREAIESILNQTFTDFEFIIVDDGNDKETVDIIKSYQDDRIVLIHNECNMGLTKSLNKALGVAKGKYIARMDADDVSYVTRFEKQYNYMEKYNYIDILGTWIYDGKRIGKTNERTSSECRRVRMLYTNAGVAHVSSFIRRRFFVEHNISYDETIKIAQDYKLWVDCLNNGAIIYVFPEVLVYYRSHDNQITRNESAEQNRFRNVIQEKLIRELCPNISDEDLHLFCSQNEWELNKKEFIRICKMLVQENNVKKIYDISTLKYELKDIYCKYEKRQMLDIGYWLYLVRRYIARFAHIAIKYG